MKLKRLSLILCAVFAVTMAAAFVTVAPANAMIGLNLLKDYTVKDAGLSLWNAGWNATGSIHKYSKESHTDDGSGSIYVEHPLDGTTNSHVAQKIELVENAKYYYSVWIKAEDIQITTHNGNGGAYIKFDDRYGGDLGGKNVALPAAFGALTEKRGSTTFALKR